MLYVKLQRFALAVSMIIIISVINIAEGRRHKRDKLAKNVFSSVREVCYHN